MPDGYNVNVLASEFVAELVIPDENTADLMSPGSIKTFAQLRIVEKASCA